ncbi:MAG: valine--tRNA ligase [Alphaproteobacteria bacterium]|nr:valine--tRNA ligase [Alphaproteobacteria bacterium]
MLAKTFTPAEIEPRLYAAWEASGAFACDVASKLTPYAIVIPPPNVTGSLHMGHALNMSLQDILIRYHRMCGRDALWQPGTDHAGIATQMVVERQLEGEGIDRRSLGRDRFIERVWAWRAESGGTITRQLRRLGASPDWQREAFTMDATLSAAVRRVFIDLYRAGLIYRDKRLVNWDCRFHTAISDLEVESRPTKGHLWYFKYPVEGMAGTHITVATTRPETMLGDTGIAVHPEDERYRHLVGRYAILPLVGRRIPIIADTYSDPALGTGAVKITPAHDFNDFEVGRRHNLPAINILDADGKLNEAVPPPFRGLDRFVARDRVVEVIAGLGLLERVDPHEHNVPYGDRSGVPVEPWLTDQWFVDAATLAQPAIRAVEEGRTRFVPQNWENTYFEWMRNIQPWCISRQIWWGHQIPAWYGPDGRVFVAEDEAAAVAAARDHYGRDTPLRRDEDVLDTWFSSALWPFSTLGWPEDTAELKRYYPTDVLVTGFDIIFFWVARMMMMGLRFMGAVPFRTVYIHALVRDERGQKMSKSKGNIIDPLDLIDKYGADALRFTLAALAAQGRDIRLSEGRVEGYRNFATKIWNAARFCEMQECPIGQPRPAGARLTVNRWIMAEASAVAARVREALDGYRFNEAAGALYQFTWHMFCDWYLELAKPRLAGADAEAAAETRATAGWVLGHILHLLHPLMPFLTEELWESLGASARHGRLITACYPAADTSLDDAVAAEEMAWLIRLIGEVRTVRAEMNVPAGAPIPLLHRDAAVATVDRLARHGDALRLLARIDRVEPHGATAVRGAAQLVIGEATFLLPLSGVIDVAQEQTRLQRRIEKLRDEIGKLDARLGDARFVAKAPLHVVEEQRQRRGDFAAEQARLQAALGRLEAA